MHRRRFFQWLGSLGIAAGTAVLGLPGVAFLIAPLRRTQRERNRHRLIRLSDLPINEPRRLVVRDRRSDAWIRYPAGPIGTVWLVRRGPREVVAYSAICPHLGCAVEYQPDLQHYHCPCHEAVFTSEGAIVSGPQPRGLDRLDVTIEPFRGEDWLSVTYRRFQPGTKETIPLG